MYLLSIRFSYGTFYGKAPKREDIECTGCASAYAPPCPKVTIHCKHRGEIRAPITAVLPSLFAAQQRRGAAVENFGVCAAAPAAADETETCTECSSPRRTTAAVGTTLVVSMVMVGEVRVLVAKAALPSRWRGQGCRASRGKNHRSDRQRQALVHVRKVKRLARREGDKKK